MRSTFLISNSLALSSPPQALLLSFFPELSSTSEKFMMLNKRRRWFHSSHVKLPSVNVSASWVFSLNIFDLDLGVQIGSVKQ